MIFDLDSEDFDSVQGEYRFLTVYMKPECFLFETVTVQITVLQEFSFRNSSERQIIPLLCFDL